MINRNTHSISLGERGGVWQPLLSPSISVTRLFNDALLISAACAVHTAGPVPCRTSYGLYCATCFLHVCKLHLGHLQAASEKSRNKRASSCESNTHTLTIRWWMIVKSSLTAAAQDKGTRLSLSSDTNTYFLTAADSEHSCWLTDTKDLFVSYCSRRGESVCASLFVVVATVNNTVKQTLAVSYWNIKI